jgi:predicted ATPase/DNA-binding SARP family transcriptional activator
METAPTRPWHIEMLGGLRVHRDPISLTRFQSQKMAALLAYLAFYPSRPHLRDELIAWLWPDDDLQAARNRLRVGLCSLRKLLDPPDALVTLLNTERTTVGLYSEAFTTDVAQFENSYAAALHTEAEAERERLLIETVEAYHGELLPGVYEDWVLSERERLAQSYLEALHRLTLLLMNRQDYERALYYARSALQSDPLRQEAHHQVMRLYLALGQPSAALQQYRELVRIWQDSFDAEPAAYIVALAQHIAATLRQSGEAKASHLALSHVTQAGSGSKSDGSDSWAAAPPYRLPSTVTPFFGRERELATLCAWFSPSPSPSIVDAMTMEAASSTTPQMERMLTPVRLVTLTGMGGIGKTRLALTLAERMSYAFANRTWFVRLADISDAHLIVGAIAETLQVAAARPIDAWERIAHKLYEPALLVLDNFEHLVDEGAPLVAQLLGQFPNLRLLITSRRTLALEGEHEFPVIPLPIPELQDRSGPETSLAQTQMTTRFNPATLLACPSVQLFVDRARTVAPDFQLNVHNAADVAALCHELEGLPLAIELAAARVRLLTPAQMRVYLKRRFELLVNRRADKDARHRSLRAAFEWSLRLLSPELRRLFARLSVFTGGWTLQAAQAICWPLDSEPSAERFWREEDGGAFDSLLLDGLERLCADSLILAEETNGEMRFGMLQSLRELAAEHLTITERTALETRHLHWFLHLAETTDAHLTGADQNRRLSILANDYENLRAAWSNATRWQDGEAALRIVGALGRFWHRQGLSQEGRLWCVQTLEWAAPRVSPPTLARAWASAAVQAWVLGDSDGALPYAEKCIRMWDATEDRRRLANALHLAGSIASDTLDHQQDALGYLCNSLKLRRELGNPDEIAATLNNIGNLYAAWGQWEQALIHYEEAMAMFRNGGDMRGIAGTLHSLGKLYGSQKRYSEAIVALRESLALFRQVGERFGIVVALLDLGSVSIQKSRSGGELEPDVSILLTEAVKRSEEMGNRLIADLARDLIATLPSQTNGPRSA